MFGSGAILDPAFAMLPTFPNAQKILDNAYYKRIFSAKAEVFPQAVHPAVRIIKEGRQSDFQRDDREIRPLKMISQQVETTIDVKEGKGLTLQMFEAKARELGQGMGKEMWKLMLRSIDEAVAETGNQVKVSGGLTREHVLRMLEMTQHGFDEDGQPTNMLVVTPAMAEELKRSDAEWKRDDEFQTKVADLKRRKRAEFNEREARRRLVD